MRTNEMDPAELALATFLGGLGYVGADAFDRWLASYNPSAADKPKDKFVSDGAGTLANCLNVGSPPGLVRLGVGVAMVAVPTAVSAVVEEPMGRAAAQGLAVGAGISLFQKVWSSFVVPAIVGTKPEDTTPEKLRASSLARIYPAEVTAAANLAAHKDASGAATPGPFNAAGLLSGPDVGPFALADSSPYDDAAQALRHAAGVSGDSPYDDTHAALRHAAGLSGDSPYSDTHAALRHAAGLAWTPAPGADTGPGPAGPQHDDCGCGVGDPGAKFAAFLGDPEEKPLRGHTLENFQKEVIRVVDRNDQRLNGAAH